MKNCSVKKIFLLPSLIIVFFFFLLPKNAFADGTSLKVSPSVLEIQAKPPADIWTPFTLENESDQPVNLTIGYKAFDPQASENGKVVFLKNGETFTGQDKNIFGKIQIVDNNNVSNNSIALGPKQSAQFRLHIILPPGEPTSDYYFSLLFLENSNTIDQNISNNSSASQRSFSTIQPGIGLNVLLAIGDKVTPNASIDIFSAPLFLEGGPVPFKLNIFDNGLHFIKPNGTIMIKNMFGQTVGKITIPPTIILAGTGRNLISKSLPNNANQGSFSELNQNGENSQEVIWPEHFLLGFYTATLSLSLSDEGPVFERSTHFFVFPLILLAEIVLIAALVFLVYRIVKRKIS